MFEFNVNNYVHVRLTESGKKELRRQYDELKREFPQVKHGHHSPKEDENGWSKWQLHVLMNRLGNIMNCGMNPPFETTIKIEAPDKEG
ncbi:MAG: hypothetical protein HQ580_19255 [Planctomycetes bacterium]|nr:hypothetical protein [Planctomycetota bacterium]